MPIKANVEEKVVEFFETAPLDTATVVFNIVRSKMKARTAQRPQVAKKPKKAEQAAGKPPEGDVI